MKQSRLFYVALILSGTLSLQAQDASSFGRPAPGAERMKLAFLVGSYTTEIHLMPSPMSEKETVGKGTSTMRWGVDSMFILLDDESVNPVLGNYKGHGVLGYDLRNNNYVLSMFNNFGDAPHYTGTMSGDTLVLTSKIEFPGGSFDQRLVWFKEGSKIRLKIYNDFGGQYSLVIDQTATPAAGESKK